MNALDLDQVRKMVTARVATLEGFQASTFTFDQLGRLPAHRKHLGFSVGVRTATPIGGRGTATSPHLVRSPVTVAVLHKVTPNQELTSEDAGVVAELRALRHVLAPAWPRALRLTWESNTRTVLNAGEWYRHDLLFNAYHYLSL